MPDTIEPASRTGTGLRLLTVTGDLAGQRVDNFAMRELRGIPRTLLYRLLRKGNVRVNGRRARPSQRLATGDEVRLPPVPGLRQPGTVPSSGKLPPVVHEDADFLVFAKRAGMAAHGGSGLAFGLIELARELRAEPGLELAHRLDRDTSGLLVLARRRAGLRWFHALLRDGKVAKTYVAVVNGRWRKDAHATLDAPLRKINATGGGRRVVVDRDGGLPALTRTRLVDQGWRGAALEIDLVTGKTHQARAHLAHAGLPIIGDTRYGDNAANQAAAAAGCRGMFLHAWRLGFATRDGGRLELEAPEPGGFAKVRKWVRG